MIHLIGGAVTGNRSPLEESSKLQFINKQLMVPAGERLQISTEKSRGLWMASFGSGTQSFPCKRNRSGAERMRRHLWCLNKPGFAICMSKSSLCSSSDISIWIFSCLSVKVKPWTSSSGWLPGTREV